MRHSIQIFSFVIAPMLFAFPSISNGHEIPWRKGVSRTVGVGHCAKGPCMKRTSFAPSVPHKHIGNGKCVGMGAASYPFGRRFKCRN